MHNAIVIAIVLLIFLNGATDACTSIAAAVCSGAISMRRAALLCGICNAVGGVCGVLFFGGIGESVLSATDFGDAGEIGVLATLGASVLFALGAWIAALPTSESHGILSAAAGASAALGRGDSVLRVLLPAVLWMSLCVLAGAAAGTVVPLLIPRTSRESTVHRWQILSAAASSLLHGVQDLSKFCAFLALSGFARADHPAVIGIAAIVMGMGALCGGRRMTDAVGDDLAPLRPRTALAADIACDTALLLLSAVGIPASTTHTKTAAVAACAIVSPDGFIRKRQFFRCILAWVITFPACAALGYILARGLYVVL